MGRQNYKNIFRADLASVAEQKKNAQRCSFLLETALCNVNQLKT
jgi:hypothetical protein